MAFLERLQMIIDADASGAAREFKKMGNTADRELGKTTKSLDKLSSKLTSVGTGALLAGGALAVGLTKFAKEASDAEAQQMKLNNSIKNSESVFAGNGKALRDQASALMKVVAADDDAIASSQSLLIQFGRTEAEVLGLTPLVVDLSRKMGIDLDTAAKAVGKASDGSSGALKKMGIEVVDLGGNASDTDNVISALSKSVGGFAETEGASYAGQLEIMNNKFGELKESIGSGILDVVNPLLSIGGALGEVNPQIGESVGKVGAIGAAGSLAVGGLSILAGQAIKLRSVFTTVDASSGVATRSLTGMGKAAAALGLVAATAVVSDFVFGIMNAGKVADNTRIAIDELTIALNDTPAEPAIGEFAKLVEAEQNTNRLKNVYEEFGAEVSIVGTGVQADIEQVQRAFDLVGKNNGPKAQLKILDELAASNKTLDKNSDQYRKNQEFIDKNRKAIELSAKATESATGATNELDLALGETADATEEAAFSTESYDRQLQFLGETQKLGADRAANFAKAIEDSSTLDDQTAAAFGMNGAYKELSDTLVNLPKDFDPIRAVLGEYTDDQNKAVQAVIGFGDAAGGVLEQAIATGNDPAFLGAILRDRLVQTLKNANIPPEQIAEYVGLAGLSEEQINIAIAFSLSEEERQKFYNIKDLFQAELDASPIEFRGIINEAVDAGEFEKASLLVKAYTGLLSPIELGFIVAADPRLAESLPPALFEAQAAVNAQPPVKVPFVPNKQEFNDSISYLQFEAQASANANPIKVPVVGIFGPDGLFAKGGLLNPGAPAGGLRPFAPSGPPTTTGGFFGSGQYSGGAVSKGGRYEVNEGGREFFTPSSDGFIMNASDAKTLVQGVSQIVSGGGGRGMTNNITITETSSPRQTALEVIRANKASLFLAGAL